MQAKRYQGKLDTLKPEAITELRQLISLIEQFSCDQNLQIRGQLNTGLTAAEMLRDDAGHLTNITLGLAIGLQQIPPEDLQELIPGQKVAAFHFGYDAGRVAVIDQPFRSALHDAELASAALEQLIEDGQFVINELERSNVSPRLKHAFDALHTKLISHKNIVQVGLCNQRCAGQLNAYIDELSGSLFELLRSHVESVFSVLAQFQDWRQFSENAAATRIDKSTVSELTTSARSLALYLKDNGDVADSVPNALETVVDWVEQGDVYDKRDVLGLVRTLENLFSVVAKSALSLASEVKGEARKAAAKLIVVGMIGVVTAGFGVAMGKIPGAEWVESTVNYLKANASSIVPK